MEDSFTRFAQSIEGDVLVDEYSKAVYATDASLYQIIPHSIVVPRNESDVIKSLCYAYKNKISILPRGGATSLAGQTVGNSVVLDFSKYMTEILEFNKEEKWVRVQPGISRDELNAFLKEYGLCFAPDPATSSRANIGGMIGNNTSGTKSILYGKTVDHVAEIKIALATGETMIFNNKTEDEYQEIARQDTKEGNIYSRFRSLIFELAEEIKKVYPKVMRRVGGYNLDEFIHTKDWNLAKLITGSEGTLATILEAKLDLVELPFFKALSVVHFNDRISAIRTVEALTQFHPSAIEILDHTVLNLAKNNILTSKHSSWINADPGAILIVEFYGDSQKEVFARYQEMESFLKVVPEAFHYPYFPEGSDYEDVWLVRKKGLGLLLSRNEKRKAIAFIEDAAIPLNHLPEYIEEVVGICEKYGVEAAVYAHASVGVIHVRPFLDMTEERDIELFKKIGSLTFELVKKYGGSWSGEHGDGLVRSPFNKRFFGEKIYQAFKEVKALFDPENLMNPGKVVDAPSPDSNLKYGLNYKDHAQKSIYHFRKEGSFEELVHMCNGVGECRRKNSGVMCPSYKATLDEKHSTRGRANALRMTMSGQLSSNDLSNSHLLEILDLCLSCKACKSECPSNVDMAKLKSEVWQKKYDRGEISIREKFISKSSQLSKRFSGNIAPLINSIQRSRPFRWTIEKTVGLSQNRILPAYAPKTLASWYQNEYQPCVNPIGKVYLFADTYVNYHDVNIGLAIVKLLSSCGFVVELINKGCCQRPRISNGFLRLAKRDGTLLYEIMSLELDDDLPILVSEPSCLSALMDDLPDLVDDIGLVKRMQSRFQSVEGFLWQALKDQRIKGSFSSDFKKIYYHGHCHEKSILGTESIRSLMGTITEVEFVEIDSGCCGMAGSFGYEKEHYDLSVQIAKKELLPHLEKLEADAKIITSGFSCRHQIKDLSKLKPLHWAEVIKFNRQG